MLWGSFAKEKKTNPVYLVVFVVLVGPIEDKSLYTYSDYLGFVLLLK